MAVRLNGLALSFKLDQIVRADSVISTDFDCRQFALTNPVPNRNNFYAISICYFIAGIQLSQTNPSFLCKN